MAPVRLGSSRRAHRLRLAGRGPLRRASNDREVGDRQQSTPADTGANETDDHPGPDLLLGDDLDQLGRRRHLLSVDRGDDVAPAETRPRSWSVVPDPAQQRSAGRDRAQRSPLAGIELSEIAQAHADVRVQRVPVLDQRGGHPTDAVDRNGISVAAARPGADGGGQADHLPVEINQRPTRIARVDVGIGQKVAALGVAA